MTAGKTAFLNLTIMNPQTEYNYQGKTRNPTGCTGQTAFLILIICLIFAAIANAQTSPVLSIETGSVLTAKTRNFQASANLSIMNRQFRVNSKVSYNLKLKK